MVDGMRVLVLGAAGAAAYNFMRSISDAHHLIAADVNPLMLQLAYTHGGPRIALTTPLGPQRVDEINQIIREHNIDFVHAQPDPEVAWLAQHARQLDAATFVPPASVVNACQDKLKTASILGDLAARSMPVENLHEQIASLNHDAWLRLRKGAGAMGALRVTEHETARTWIEHWRTQRAAYGDWMLAEYLPGDNLSWTGIYRSGELVVSVAKRRDHLMSANTHPASVSSTASVQTIIRRRDINETCEAAVQLLDPHADGIWMFDLKENAHAEPKITECNIGRFGTTSLMYRAAGCNLPLIYLRTATGDTTPTRRDPCEWGRQWIRQPDMGCMLADNTWQPLTVEIEEKLAA